ncbi:Piso0_003041 [Millerozyma farinosa CBS 7064]|uniref:Uridine kinase n=1 Tax=Pichia sorbitophila (strain ATCC MYA-4447 / BCRC 22081 / CBS 7064 / NBRC 10061 / NRRL Y-12695) TaxID=559304 RepID=G8YH11_PICSO|nr:Piso0_003041 [Millerozyma farinosa CBS 7064]CCE80713.1 Piso0_003041 [Millerozyma farinosa CBS 7064]
MESKRGRSRTRISPYHDNDSSFFRSSSKLQEERDSLTDSSELNSYIPPWTVPYIIGVAGYSASGKTSISQKIISEINQPWTVLLSLDNFYKPLSKEERKLAFENEFDFDTPSSLDLDLLVEVIKSLKNGKKTEIPIYSFVKHDRTSKTATIYGANVIIIEGIYALYDQRLLDLMDIKIYVDTDLDVCLSRRLTRDILYRGRDLSGALKQWEKFVKPDAVRYVYPTINAADLVIPRGLDNTIAIDLMIKHIQKQLAMKSQQHLLMLKNLRIYSDFDIKEYPNAQLLPVNNQTRVLFSSLFCKETNRPDFVFTFDRLATLIIERAIDFLTNYEDITVKTASGYSFSGLKPRDEIIAVNIIRSGDCFMNSVKKTIPEVLIGKLLILSDTHTGEPQLHMDSLPPSIEGSNKKVLLFDAHVISGAALIMAVKVLVDHGVKLENIVFCCCLCTEIGLRRILKVFPSVKMVIGKLSNMDDHNKFYEDDRENLRDTDWPFRTRFIDSLYFGT